MPLSTWSLPAVPWGRVTQLFSCFYPRCPFLSLSKSDSAWDDTHQTMLLPTWPACMSSQPMDVSWFWIEKHNGFQPAAAAALEQYGQPWVFAASHGGHQTPHLQLQLVPGRMGQWGCKPGWGTTPACMLSDCHFVGVRTQSPTLLQGPPNASQSPEARNAHVLFRAAVVTASTVSAWGKSRSAGTCSLHIYFMMNLFAQARRRVRNTWSTGERLPRGWVPMRQLQQGDVFLHRFTGPEVKRPSHRAERGQCEQ